MRQTRTGELIVEIDDQVAALVKEINSVPDGSAQLDFIEACRDAIVDSLIGPFGLSRSMFIDKDGGNITTVHNFEKGIVATEEDARCYENYRRANAEPVDRRGYEKTLPQDRKAILNQDGPITDAYTGQELQRDGQMHMDHVVSVASIERSAKGHLAQTREEREQTANLPENKVPTHASINRSKRDRPLDEWMRSRNRKDPSKTNAEAYNIDEKRARQIQRRAERAVNRVQNIAVLRKQSRALLHVGVRDAGRFALRQLIGLFLRDVAEGIIADVRTIIREGFEGLEQLATILRDRITQTIQLVRQKWRTYLGTALDGGVSAFIHNLVTLLINSLWTTAKNVVRILREGTLSVVRAVRTIVSPPPDISKAELAHEVFKILSGALVVALGIGLEEAIKKLIEAIAPLAPFAGTMAPVIAGLITGIGSLVVILAFDKMRNHIKFENKQIADVHRNHTITLLQIKKAAVVIDQARYFFEASSGYMRRELTTEWAELGTLGRATDDMIEEYSNAIHRLKSLPGAF